MKKLNSLLVLLPFLTFAHGVWAIKLKPGHWHTEFELRPGVNLPVDFFYVKGKQPALIIKNGEERISLTQMRVQNDSLFIPFPTFDSELKIKVHSQKYLTGAWFNHTKSPTYNVPFWSQQNENPRFPFDVKLNTALEGRWEVTFDYRNEREKAVGLFQYSNLSAGLYNTLAGTFLTETGDYRFLEGASIGDSLYLSCFDGSHAFLFRAQLKNDTLWGDFHSGNHYKTDWFAVKNESFELRHPDSLTYVVNEKPLEFDLPKLDGTNYHYPNESVKNKVVLIQIMGTWCPNCLDESNYLKTVYANHSNEVEILAVTFETQKTTEDKMEAVRKYKDALGLNYTFLIGGDACKPCASKTFPQLNDIISFPTLIFIDKSGEIRKIHTGFSGPGTGHYYTDFVAETDLFISTLIQE
ncbi:MAG: TlpA family protein disulfide reductase [Bacteroidetes bacterium]|nr:TlpA family protein disulfide reductase [Bacteroidota bacterium]